MSVEAAKTFFKSSHFAVVGASNNTAKYGHKVFAWYVNHSLAVTPINPTSASIEVHSKPYPTVPKLASLSSKPGETSVSIITPPAATREVLREAKELGIRAVWMQPGSFDADVLEYAKTEGGFEAVVAGTEGGSRGEDGWCVLVDGERALRAAGKL